MNDAIADQVDEAAVEGVGTEPYLTETPRQVSRDIASWRRILHLTQGDPRSNFQQACRELLARAREYPGEIYVRRTIVDALYEIADQAGIDVDEAQQFMASEPAAPTHANGHSAVDEPPLPEPNDYGSPMPVVSPIDISGVPLTIADWLARDLPPADYLLGAWLTTTSRVLLSAPTGLGKTNFAMALAAHVAANKEFLHWRAHRPAKVLYVDGEMSRQLLKSRAGDIARRLGFDPEGFHLLSHEDVEGFAPLNTPEGRTLIERFIERLGGVDLIVLTMSWR